MAEKPLSKIEAAVDQFLSYLEQHGARPNLEGFTAEEKAETAAIFQLLEACWGEARFAPPPLENDQLAQELGLVEEQAPDISLDGRAVRSARQRRDFNLQQLVDILGLHEVDVQMLFRLEQGTVSVPEPVALALASALNTSVESLRAKSTPRLVTSITEYFRSTRFTQLIRDYARRRGQDELTLRDRVIQNLQFAPQRSSGQPDDNTWEQLVIALIESLPE